MYMTMGYFCLASILSFVILGFLIHNILKTFTDNELSQEMRQLIVSQSIFVCTFLVRVVLIILVTNKMWIDFLRQYPKCMYEDYKTVMFSFQFIIYNIIPYSTLMLFHHLNLKPQKDKDKKSTNKNSSNTVHYNTYTPTSNSESSNINGKENLLKMKDGENELNTARGNPQVF